MARALMPGIWVVGSDGNGIVPHDWRKYGYLDLVADDDEEPKVFPPEIAEILGFDPSTDQLGTNDAFVETEHPRGQPENKGEFAKVKGASTNAGQTSTSKRSAPTGPDSKRYGPDTTSTGQQPGANARTSNTNVAGTGGAVRFIANRPAATFHKAISVAVQASNAGAAVHVYEPDEYSSMRCFLTLDKSAGFALKGDDIVSVFKHPESPHKRVAIAALAEAVKLGGRRLDCFDTVLPGFYSNNHFRAVARIKFDDEYAPEGWDYKRMAPFNKGKPDVVFMVYDPNYNELYKPGDGQLVDDYDEAEAIQKEEVKSKAKKQDAPVSHAGDAFNEAQHPRGQPENKGEFAKANTSVPTPQPGSTEPHAAVATAASTPAPDQLFTSQDMALPTQASQPTNNPDILNHDTIAAQEQLEDWLNKGKGVSNQLGYTTMSVSPGHADLSQPGGMLFIGKPKSMTRAAEKVQSDYGGDWSKLLDPVRCSFACDDFEEVKRVLHALKASGMKLARKPKDRFANPTEAGYRDCLINVVLPNGLIGEVQLHTKAMLQAKAEGHHYYEIERTLDAASKTRNLTVEERQQKTAARDAQLRIYQDAWGAVLGKFAADVIMGQASQYSYYEYENAYYRRLDRNGMSRSIDEVLHGNTWVPYTGDALAPVVFGDRCDNPLLPKLVDKENGDA